MNMRNVFLHPNSPPGLPSQQRAPFSGAILSTVTVRNLTIPAHLESAVRENWRIDPITLQFLRAKPNISLDEFKQFASEIVALYTLIVGEQAAEKAFSDLRAAIAEIARNPRCKQFTLCSSFILNKREVTQPLFDIGLIFQHKPDISIDMMREISAQCNLVQYGRESAIHKIQSLIESHPDISIDMIREITAHLESLHHPASFYSIEEPIAILNAKPKITPSGLREYLQAIRELHILHPKHAEYMPLHHQELKNALASSASAQQFKEEASAYLNNLG